MKWLCRPEPSGRSILGNHISAAEGSPTAVNGNYHLWKKKAKDCDRQLAGELVAHRTLQKAAALEDRGDHKEGSSETFKRSQTGTGLVFGKTKRRKQRSERLRFEKGIQVK